MSLANETMALMSTTEAIPELKAGLQRSAIGVPAPLSPQAPAANRVWLSDTALDLTERLLVLALFGWLVARMVSHYLATSNIGSLVLLPSEGLVVFFIIIRRFGNEISRRPGEWLMAMGATITALLAGPGIGYSLVSPVVGVTVLLMGMIIQLHAKIALGRRFGCIPAHRGLKLTGPYRVVRHPMYLGYLVSHVAFLALNPTLWNAAIYVVCYSLQIPRILAEERLLSHDPQYREYQKAVRFRLVPWVF